MHVNKMEISSSDSLLLLGHNNEQLQDVPLKIMGVLFDTNY